MQYLLILNDPPYGTERSYNGLRLAASLAKVEGTAVSVFLIGDAASCAVAGQATPNGYYNLERMLKVLSAKRGEDRCLWFVHGRPRHKAGDARSGSAAEFDGRIECLGSSCG